MLKKNNKRNNLIIKNTSINNIRNNKSQIFNNSSNFSNNNSNSSILNSFS